MSYCRFSSDNWWSDVYTYEHYLGGWVTHVACRRLVMRPIPDLPIRLAPSFSGAWSMSERRMLYPSRWHALAARIFFGFWAFWHNRVHMLSHRLIPLRAIGLPFDGHQFTDASPGECADRLESLRAAGYRVPQFAIDNLRDEDREARAAIALAGGEG